MGVTTDRDHPDLKRSEDEIPVPQQGTYLVLSDEERAKGFVQPVRQRYKHKEPTCGAVTTMGLAIAETYARDPWFYGGTYCTGCNMHRPLDEFIWEPDGQEMAPKNWTDEQLQAVIEAQKR